MRQKPDTLANIQKLTRKQRQLSEQVRDTALLLRLNYSDIGDYDSLQRTGVLEAIKRQLVLSEVVMRYTLVDEFLSTALCSYFFGKKKSTVELWKTRKFRNFNFYVVEVLSLNEKLRFFKATYKDVPKGIAENIERLVALRNGIAHAFVFGKLIDTLMRTAIEH